MKKYRYIKQRGKRIRVYRGGWDGFDRYGNRKRLVNGRLVVWKNYVKKHRKKKVEKEKEKKRKEKKEETITEVDLSNLLINMKRLNAKGEKEYLIAKRGTVYIWGKVDAREILRALKRYQGQGYSINVANNKYVDESTLNAWIRYIPYSEIQDLYESGEIQIYSDIEDALENVLQTRAED